jgi:hypothetical protein
MSITTNRGYLEATLTRFGLTATDIDAIMVEHTELEGALNVALCKKAMYESMSAILPVANVSEGGYSISWNIEALKLWYGSLCSELGKINALKPKVNNRSNMW